MTAYTLARWHVKEGREDDFVAAWTGVLGAYFSTLPGVGRGTLIRSVEDPRIFYSFGPWDSLDDIANMRAKPETQEVFAAMAEVCDEMTPGAYELVAGAGADDPE